MSDISCGYTGDREAMLMAYLYDEIAPEDRDPFTTHLAGCARCRAELNALGGVRSQLAHWAPPVFAGTDYRAPDRGPAAADEVAARRWRWLEIPVWAQAAAAMLVLGASAGVANLDVHYDAANGLNVRTGWKGSQGSLGSQGSQGSPTVARASDAVSRAELVRLEQQLRSEFRPQQSGPANGSGGRSPAADADLVRRVKAMVDESERRQQREMALRMAEIVRDLNAQRQADLRKIDQNLGLMQDRTGVEVLRTRQQVDYLMQRVSQRR